MERVSQKKSHFCILFLIYCTQFEVHGNVSFGIVLGQNSCSIAILPCAIHLQLQKNWIDAAWFLLILNSKKKKETLWDQGIPSQGISGNSRHEIYLPVAVIMLFLSQVHDESYNFFYWSHVIQIRIFIWKEINYSFVQCKTCKVKIIATWIDVLFSELTLILGYLKNPLHSCHIRYYFVSIYRVDLKTIHGAKCSTKQKDEKISIKIIVSLCPIIDSCWLWFLEIWRNL